MPTEDALEQIKNEMKEYRDRVYKEIPEGAITIAGAAEEMNCSDNTAKAFLNKKVKEGLLLRQDRVRIEGYRGVMVLYLPNPDYEKPKEDVSEKKDPEPKSSV